VTENPDNVRLQLYNDHKKQAWGDIQSSTDSYDQSLLTLSSGGLGLSIAFIKDIVPLHDAMWLWLLYSSWIAFALCILTTVISFQIAIEAQKEHLDNCYKYYFDGDETCLNKRGKFSRCLTKCTILAGGFFILALACTIVFAIGNVERAKMANDRSKKSQEGKGPISLELEKGPRSISQDGRSPMNITPVPDATEKRGRDSMKITPVPGKQASNTQTAAESSGIAATQSGTPLEKGRDAVPIVPTPTEVQKPVGGTAAPEKKK
jgi:hypothetical protein